MRFSRRSGIRFDTGSPSLVTSLLAAALLLAGCQSFKPQPLSTAAPSWPAIDRIAIDPQAVRIPSLQSHRFDPSDGLDIDEVATLAVVGNPDLKLARADLGIAQAQSFAAGLIPDPQLSLSGETARPRQENLVPAFNVGLQIDVAALLSLSQKKNAAVLDARKLDAALLWQEWQVASQARQLFVKQRALERQLVVMRRMFDAQSARYALADQAVKERNLPVDASIGYLVSREDWRKQTADAERQLNQTRHDLALLLGLAPDTRLDLVGPTTVAPIDEAATQAMKAQLADLAHRRPDLVALEYGYASQEQKLRAAILAQFPAVTIGPTRLRDNTGVYSTGFAASISLPIFNRNRGNLAIENATRDRLRQEYDVRLRAAHAEVDRALSEDRLLEQQWQAAARTLPLLDETLRRAGAALDGREITITTYVDLQTTVAARQLEVLGLEQGVLTQRLALNALLGASDIYPPPASTSASR